MWQRAAFGRGLHLAESCIWPQGRSLDTPGLGETHGLTQLP